MKDAKTLMENRKNRIRFLFKEASFSLLDLCRIFEVSPLGMKALLCSMENEALILSEDPHPILCEWLMGTGEVNEENYEDLGYYRVPKLYGEGIRLLSEGLVDGDVIINCYKQKKGAIWRKREGRTARIVIPNRELNLINELWHIGFKKSEMEEYVKASNEKFPGFYEEDWTAAILAAWTKFFPGEVITRKKRPDAEGEVKTYESRLPVQIATDAELGTMMQHGYGIKQIVMLTGDQAVTVTQARIRLNLEKSHVVNGRCADRDMFKAYLEGVGQTEKALAENLFGKTRTTFSKRIKKYLSEQATEEEKALFEERKKHGKCKRSKTC